MPITVKYKNMTGHECILRPSPLISIATEVLKSDAGIPYGVNYNITLTGSLLTDEGNPIALNPSTGGPFAFKKGGATVDKYVGPYNCFIQGSKYSLHDGRPEGQLVNEHTQSQVLLLKQRAIRALFADDGQRMEITDFLHDSLTGGIICYPRVVSVDFAEGDYINKCDYTIVLQADTLYTGGKVDSEGNKDISTYGIYQSIVGANEDDFLKVAGNAYIQDFSESWSIETDESADEIEVTDEDLRDAGFRAELQSAALGSLILPRRYVITHNISATGKDHYHPHNFSDNTGFNNDPLHGDIEDADGNHSHTAKDFVERLDASQQARKFIEARLTFNVNIIEMVIRNYLGREEYEKYGRAIAEYVYEYYKGFNHQRTETMDEAGGSYSVQDTWQLEFTPPEADDDDATEDSTISVSSSAGNTLVKVSINGTLKGKSTAAAMIGGGLGGPRGLTAFERAMVKWHTFSNNGRFGLNSTAYKRCNNTVAVQLNSEPLSISVEVNEADAEISYSVEYDNRPTNFISNAIQESISINDTYPGDIFAVIPVIGRQQGPILQYIGGRTEYKRSFSLSLTMDYTSIAYDATREELMLLKPSVAPATAKEIHRLIRECSPAEEPNIRKYFCDPPTESWSPKTGQYTLNINWTYEIDE